MRKLLLTILITTLSLFSFSQGGSDCLNAEPFCSDQSYTFPMGVGTTAQSGPDYGCLITQPNPYWYYLQVDQSGDITIYMDSPTGNDIDFICWGPFTTPTGPCTAQLNSTYEVDCSFSINSWEECNISNALSGEYYMLLITNYSNSPGNIVFNQTNFGQPGAGSTDCSIICGVDAGPDQQTCGGSVTIGGNPTYQNGATPVTYSWDNGAGTSANPIVSPSSTTTYTVTMTTSDGCTSTDGVTVTVSNPQINPITITSDNCGSCNGTATITMSSGASPFTYNIGSSSNTTGLFTNLCSGNYTITITDMNSCTATQQFIIDAIGSVTAGFSINDDTQCLTSNSFNFTNTGSSGVGVNHSWIFTSSNIPNSTLENPTNITWNVPGTYNITQTITSGSCIDAFQSTITVYPMPTISVTTTPETCYNICDGSVSAVPVGTFTYNWTGPSGPLTQTTQVVNNLCSGTYIVTITDNNGCTATNSGIITAAIPMNINNISFTQPTCNGLSDGTITINASGGSIPLSYSIPGYPNNQTGQFTNIMAGSYTVVVSDVNGCSLSQNIIVTEPTPLVLNSSTHTNVSCNGLSDGTITVNASGGSGIITYYSTYSNTSGVFNGLNAGTYIITVSDINGCSLTTTETIMEPEPIVSTITAPQTICNGSSTNLSVVISGGTGPFIYHWGHTTNTTSTVSVNPINATNYTCQVEDINGCLSNIVSTTVSVTSQVQIDVISSPSAVCHGESVTLTANITQGVGSPYIITYNCGVVSLPLTIYPNQTGSYVLTVEDGCGSTATDDVLITVHPAIVVSFTSSEVNGCEPLKVNFNPIPVNSSYQYFWNFNDNSNSQISYAVYPEHTFNAGTYDVTLTVKDQFGCVHTNSIQNFITVYPLPHSAFTTNQNMASDINPQITFHNLSSGAVDYLWSFGDGDSSSVVNPYHRFNGYDDFLITLIAYSNHGCPDTSELIITIYEECTFYTPTAFSPDMDGTNDFFQVFGKCISDDFKLYVYDRWGEVIWEGNSIDDKWDGRAKDNRYVPIGVYSWLCKYKTTTEVYKERAGIVTIIR
jgi:gliding motility-associated-like protein